MPVSPEQFLKELEQSGLFSAEEVTALASSVPADKRRDAAILAGWLVENHKLTKYQAMMVYQGKSARLVLGNYVILDMLGQGGMGLVFKARHRRMDRLVAVKVPPAEAIKSDEMIPRFQREVRAAAKLNHPNV